MKLNDIIVKYKNHYPSVNLDYIRSSIDKQIIVELSFSNLHIFNFFNTITHKIKEHDFERYFNITITSGYKEPGNTLKIIKDGSEKIPILLRDINNTFWVLKGDELLSAYKVLGINPLVNIVDVDCDLIL